MSPTGHNCAQRPRLPQPEDPIIEELLGSLPSRRAANPVKHMENVSLVRVKAAHHRIAQFCATGLSNVEVGALTGYTPQYISNLRTGNPAFQELVSHYTRKAEAEMLDLRAKQARLGEMAVDELTDRLAENPEQYSIRELLEVVEKNANEPREVDARGKWGNTSGPPSPITIQFVTAGQEPATGPLIEGEKE